MGKQFILSRKLKGRIVGTAGSDRVRASKRSFAKPKFFIHREGSVSLLGGNDKIVSRYGMEVRGPIRMGAGCDVITGKKGLVVNGFDYQRGSLYMGPGADAIRFPKGRIVFVNGRDSACVSMGGGNDGINGQSLRISDATDVLMGAGNDQVESTDGMQVWGWSKLDMGEGNDSLRVQGGLVMDPGFIDMGSGDDTVEVEGGIQMYSYDDSSWIRLGEGNDRFSGFASPRPDFPSEFPPEYDGIIDGGLGQDTLVLPQGVYTITPTQVSTSLASLNVQGFEALEGINGGRFPYLSGILTVDRNGIASFASTLA